MTVRIELRDGEAIQEALRRLRQACRHAYRREWHKTRPGAYHKPSDRKRRRESLRLRNVLRSRFRRSSSRVTVFLGLSGLHARGEPFENADQRYHRRARQRHRDLADVDD